jgi:hypothetical protein
MTNLNFLGVPVYVVFQSKDKFKRVRVPKHQYVQESITWVDNFECLLINVQTDRRYKGRKCVYATFYDRLQKVPFVLLLVGTQRLTFLANYMKLLNYWVKLKLVEQSREYVPSLQLMDRLTEEELGLRRLHHSTACRQFKLPEKSCFVR